MVKKKQQQYNYYIELHVEKRRNRIIKRPLTDIVAIGIWNTPKITHVLQILSCCVSVKVWSSEYISRWGAHSTSINCAPTQAEPKWLFSLNVFHNFPMPKSALSTLSSPTRSSVRNGCEGATKIGHHILPTSYYRFEKSPNQNTISYLFPGLRFGLGARSLLKTMK